MHTAFGAGQSTRMVMTSRSIVRGQMKIITTEVEHLGKSYFV